MTIKNKMGMQNEKENWILKFLLLRRGKKKQNKGVRSLISEENILF